MMILEIIQAKQKRSTVQVDMPSLTHLHKPRQLPGLWHWEHSDKPGSVWPRSPALPLQLNPSHEPEAHLPTLPHATTHKLPLLVGTLAKKRPGHSTTEHHIMDGVSKQSGR